MKLNQIATIPMPSDIHKPFSLCCSNNYINLTTKQSIYLFHLNYRPFSEDFALNYTQHTIACNQKLPTSIIDKNETKIYNAASMNDRHMMMLDQVLLPNAAVLYITCAIGEVISEPQMIVAQMTSAGQLSFYMKKSKTSAVEEAVDVSKHLAEHIYDKSHFSLFEDYKKTVDSILITCFCFRDKIISDNVQFCVSIKSGKIFILTLEENIPKIEHTFESNQVNSYMKWITLQRTKTGFKNLLLVGRLNGKISLFTLENTLGGEVSKFDFLIDLWTEEDDIPISHIEIQICTKSKAFLAICVKGSFILVFNIGFDGKVYSKLIKDVGLFCVTGIQHIEAFKYLLCTLSGVILHLTFSVSKKTINLQIDQVATDFDQLKYQIYGISTTKNRACIMLAAFPSQPFDHLVLREPTRLIFCQFSGRNPLDIITKNASFKMTDYYDCAEIIRISGSKQLSAIPNFDVDNNVISRNEEHVYQLKLRLVQLSAKISYFKRRHQIYVEKHMAEYEAITRIINLIHYSKALEYFTNFKIKTNSLLTDQQLRSARMCRNIIQQYLNEEFEEQFKIFQEMLCPEFTEIVEKANYLDDLTIPAETCTICGHLVLRDFVDCMNEHTSLKCAISGLSILPIDECSICQICSRSFISLTELQAIFPSTIDCRACPVCDVEVDTLNL